MKTFIVVTTIIGCLSNLSAPAPDLENDRFEIYVQRDHSWIIKEKRAGTEWLFKPDFAILISSQDPAMAMRPAGITNVMYNVVTWKSPLADQNPPAKATQVGRDVAGDGFDDRILKGNNQNRTADVFKAGHLFRRSAISHKTGDDKVVFQFASGDMFALSATLSFDKKAAFPILEFSIRALKENFFSVGYVGAPGYAPGKTSEIWQPMIWQEKRFPEHSFLTLAFQCPVPSALVCADQGCVGVVADPQEFPFDPLPLLDNSRFGIALRDEGGNAKPMLFAPALGGLGSKLTTGSTFNFAAQLFVGAKDLTMAYEDIARNIYGFDDYRRNTTHTLNETLDNMLEYGMSQYSMFVDSLKGCAYSTDVPGAVKNVSSLNPLQMALLADREDIYRKRAYPVLEFLLSREKFLFTLDSTQKIQNPSRKMNGPVAPISELAALYQISGRNSKALLDLAEKEFSGSRTRNLAVKEDGATWQNALALYRATGNKHFLEKAVKGAKEYLAKRISEPSQDFDDVEGRFFFWNGFTPDWINLFQLYEATGDKILLEAARSGARHYTMFCWYAPSIPDDSIVVNKDNKAPHYWYLKAKGHSVMRAPEETVPAWQLSEIGLTPESSGTCSGHRAIFMANYAPWMMRIGFLTNDLFLLQTGRAAIIGRYANFPGYHINTGRTTAYEKADYPLRPFKELSVNSFHFNHIWPQMSILADYLFTDAYIKSAGQIDVPSTYIEGYAYLQSKFYGHAPGEFYGEHGLYAWMPRALLTTESKQLNYIALRGENALYLAFLNQSGEHVTSNVTLNPALFSKLERLHNAKVWINNGKPEDRRFVNGQFQLEVKPHAITAVKIEGVKPRVRFQDRILQGSTRVNPGLISLRKVNGKALVLDFGQTLRTLYVYLQSDDQKVNEAVLHYSIGDKKHALKDSMYPFEFTIRLPEGSEDVKVSVHVTDQSGMVTREDILLRGK